MHVTRREFYSALVIIWIYIMLVLGNLFKADERWTTGLLWAASLLMVIAYSVAAFLGKPSRGTVPIAAMSDRVKELASDPSRKIEAIKLYREETGLGLAEAKEAVEQIMDGK